MADLKIAMKTDMEELKKLLQERVTNGEKVVKELMMRIKEMLIMIP